MNYAIYYAVASTYVVVSSNRQLLGSITGSLADFIAPDWEIESGDEGKAAEDDDYENESTDENEEAGDGGDDRPKRAYLPNRDAMACL
ncbi:hypothetical protein MY4038_010258 [Beauveria bassiana]